jgi:hypothetical protein
VLALGLRHGAARTSSEFAEIFGAHAAS